MRRPFADVVVPFAGDAAALAAVVERLAGLTLRDGDTVTVADNRRGSVAPPAPRPPVRVVPACDVRSSYHARNRGAGEGRAEWIVFLDADVRFDADLLDRLLDPPPGETTGVLAGAIVDEVITDGAVARLLRDRGAMSQRNTLAHARPYAQTAHCAVRRAAFESIGGFREAIRSGGDADLCWRLDEAGWALEERPGAIVRHEARATLRAVARQVARHGAGAAWLERRYPGSMPPRSRPGLAWWGVCGAALGAWRLARRDRDGALDAVLGPALTCAFEAGRLLPNRALDLRRASPAPRR